MPRSNLSRPALVVVVGVLLAAGAAGATGPRTSPGTATQVKALVAASVKIAALNATTTAALPGAATDDPAHKYHLPDECLTATDCVLGDTSSSTTVVLFGDSHSRMWLPAILPSALADHVRLVLIGKDGCPVVSIDFTQRLFTVCNGLRPGEFATINGLKPLAVILADRTSYPGFTSAQWQAGMAATLHALSASGSRLTVIGDIQVFGNGSANVLGCLATYPNDVQKCAQPLPNTKVHGEERAERAATQAAHGTYVDPTPWLCTASRCSPVIGNFIAYFNAAHVSVTYATYLSKVMGLALRSTL